MVGYLYVAMIRYCVRRCCNEDTIGRQLVVGVLLLVSLSGPQIAVAQDLDECDVGPVMAFEEWSEWTATSPKPYRSTEHRDWVKIYIDDLARASAQATAEQYAECAKIAKVHFTDFRGDETYLLILMVKMPAGFDPDDGDWLYAMYDTTVGTSVIEQGIIKNCIACHKRASGMDYIFSKEIIEKLVE